MPTANTLTLLYDAGAHMLVCETHKGPRAEQWFGNRLDLNGALSHHGGGGLLGLVPASLGMVVVDVDRGEWSAAEDVMLRLGRPLVVVPSRRDGGLHLWYRASGPARNGQWLASDGKGGGDIRGGYGYVVLRDPAAVVTAARMHPFARPVDAETLIDRSLAECRHRLDWNPDPDVDTPPWRPVVCVPGGSRRCTPIR